MTYDKQQAGEMTFITADQDMTMGQQLADLRAALRGAGIQSLLVGGRSLKLRQGAHGQAIGSRPTSQSSTSTRCPAAIYVSGSVTAGTVLRSAGARISAQRIQLVTWPGRRVL